MSISINFKDYPELEDKLKSRALANFRTPMLEALAIISAAMEYIPNRINIKWVNCNPNKKIHAIKFLREIRREITFQGETGLKECKDFVDNMIVNISRNPSEYLYTFRPCIIATNISREQANKIIELSKAEDYKALEAQFEIIGL